MIRQWWYLFPNSHYFSPCYLLLELGCQGCVILGFWEWLWAFFLIRAWFTIWITVMLKQRTWKALFRENLSEQGLLSSTVQGHYCWKCNLFITLYWKVQELGPISWLLILTFSLLYFIVAEICRQALRIAWEWLLDTGLIQNPSVNTPEILELNRLRGVWNPVRSSGSLSPLQGGENENAFVKAVNKLPLLFSVVPMCS